MDEVSTLRRERGRCRPGEDQVDPAPRQLFAKAGNASKLPRSSAPRGRGCSFDVTTLAQATADGPQQLGRWRARAEEADAGHLRGCCANVVMGEARRQTASVQISYVDRSMNHFSTRGNPIIVRLCLEMSAANDRPLLACAVLRRRFSSGCKPHPANAPAGSTWSSHGGNEVAEAFG